MPADVRCQAGPSSICPLRKTVMLIVFQSKAAADVLMFSAHALTIMQVIGRSYTDSLPERGVITHEQLPAAIAAIEQAISDDKHNDDAEHDHNEDDIKMHPIAEPVSFRQRVWPLLSMLRASHEQDVDVMWEPAPRW